MRAKREAREDTELEAEDDAETEDEPEDLLETEPDEPRETRKEKKYVRGRIRNLEEELEAERRRRRELEEHAHQASIHRMYQPPPGQPQKDPLDDAVDNAYEEQMAFQREYEAVSRSRELTADEQKKYLDRAKALEQKKMAAVYSREAARSGAQNPGPSPEQVADQARLQGLMEEFSDVYGHQDRVQLGNGATAGRAAIWADNEYRKLLAEGAPRGVATAKKALTAARERFFRRDQPDRHRRAAEKFTGPPRGANGASEGSTRVVMTTARKKMAESLYKNLPAEKAWQKWANGPGRRRAT